VFWGLAPSATTIQDCTFNATQTLTPDAMWIAAKTEEYRQQYENMGGPGSKFTAYVSVLVANLLLVMQARPEYVEKQGSGRTNRRLKSGVPVWPPIFIGRKYITVRKSQAAEGGHFTEIEWRAGCMRSQHYGPKNEQIKVIFIDPYICFCRGLVPIKEKNEAP
jgi:hypothetical protein